MFRDIFVCNCDFRDVLFFPIIIHDSIPLFIAKDQKRSNWVLNLDSFVSIPCWFQIILTFSWQTVPVVCNHFRREYCDEKCFLAFAGNRVRKHLQLKLHTYLPDIYSTSFDLIVTVTIHAHMNTHIIHYEISTGGKNNLPAYVMFFKRFNHERSDITFKNILKGNHVEQSMEQTR